MLIKVPDLRGGVALLTAILVIVQQLFPGAHWTTAVTAIVGALVVHTTAPSSSTSSASSTTPAPSSPPATAPNAWGLIDPAPSSTSTAAPSSTSSTSTAAP